MALFDGIRRSLSRAISPDSGDNIYNRIFYGLTGQSYTAYDINQKTYLNKGFLYNPTVYSVIKQKSDKARSVPFFLKRINDERAKADLDVLYTSTKGQFTGSQIARKTILERKAYDDEMLPMPIPRPNPLQTWEDIVSLYETFMNVTGNFYLYLHRGAVDKTPVQCYVLPSHLITIILKSGASMLGTESPIHSYRLKIGTQFHDFPSEDVIHVKLPNPDYGNNGEHLYGLSPLRAALRNIQSSNEAIDNNNRMLRNSGSFGFIHGKNVPLTQEQADSMKRRLTEMRSTTDALGQVAGATAELAFTRVSLTTDELKPFDYLSFDEKQICNVLGWDDKLLNNDNGAKYDNVQWAERRVLVNSIMPSLNLLAAELNDSFLPEFKNMNGLKIVFDYSELPEMQTDMKELVEWASVLIREGVLNRDEVRGMCKFNVTELPEMAAHTVNVDVIPLPEAISNDNFTLNQEPN